MGDKPKTKLEEIEERRAKRKEASAEARAEQYAKDLEAIDALEVAEGEEITTMSVKGFRAGLPSIVGLRAPQEAYYKRYGQQVRAAAQNLEARARAQELLAQACWVYPAEPEVRDAMCAAFPGTLISIALEALKLAELRAEDEGKG